MTRSKVFRSTDSGDRVTVTPLCTGDSTPLVSGTIDVRDFVSMVVRINGVSYTPTVTDKTWSVVVTEALDIGDYDVEAIVETLAGTITDDTTNELCITSEGIAIGVDDEPNGVAFAWDDNGLAIGWDN